jgi:hypothetical protein
MELVNELVTTDKLTAAFTRALSEWARQQPGNMTVHRATDPWNAVELLCQGPTEFRAVVVYAGDDPAGTDSPFSLISDHRWDVYITMPLGLHADPASVLTKGTPSRPAMLRMLDELKAFCLALRWPEELTETLMKYGGAEGATLPDGLPIAAYRLRFSLTAATATAAEHDAVDVDMGGI